MKGFKISSLFLVSFFVLSLANIEEIRKQCQSVEGLKSCGLCMKQHPECAWCSEPDVDVPRCDHKAYFGSTCPSAQGASGKSEVTVPPQHNYPMGFSHPHYHLPIQITPQQAYLKIKPGEHLEVSFVYRHMRPSSGVEVRDFALQTSDLNAIGLDIAFDIECHGSHVLGKTCQGVQEGDEVRFTATVTLKECKSGGDVAASIGVYGYNMVSAIFVTPLCACECEKAKNVGPYDRRCNAAGRLVCGKCVCEKGFGGPKCQCDLAKYGASSAEDLENQCRRSPDEPVCSAKGSCECGTCKCKGNFIQGQFCECDSTSCPKDSDGRLCSGRGECECGTCRCEEGFEGDDCGCTSDEAACRENGQICSNNGKCVCGRCACRDGFTGAFCSVEQPSNAKDGSTLNENEFNDDGDLLPSGDDRDQGVEAAKAEEQESDAPGTRFSIQALLGVLVALLTVKIGLLLA